MGRKLPSPLH